MQNLVISAVVKLVDQVSAPLRTLMGSVTATTRDVGASFNSSAAGLVRWGAALTGVASAGAAFSKVVAATIEAQKTVVQFDIAFRAREKSVGQTREQLLRFADEASTRTIFDDESLIRAQTSLLRFRAATGDTFLRAREAAINLASAMDGDVVSAANTVGRAIERPSIALRMLRQYGIIFSRDQEMVIRQLEKTGKAADAADIVLRELERRFKGASDTAVNTLGGALTRLKNSFDNLFEAADNGEALTKSINDLNGIIASSEFKNSLQVFAAALLDIASFGARAITALGNLGDKIGDVIAKMQGLPQAGADRFTTAISEQQRELDNLTQRYSTMQTRRRMPNFMATDEFKKQETELLSGIRRQEALIKELQKARDEAQLTGVKVTAARTAPTGGGTVGTVGTAKSAADAITEVIIASARKTSSATQDLYAQWEESTRTTIQKQVAQYERLISVIDELARAGRISQEDAAARTREVVEASLQEIQLASRKVNVTPALDQTREAFMNFANSVGNSLGNAISQGGFEGMTTLRDILRNTLRGILADILSSGIRKGLMSIFEGVMGGGKSGGGVMGFLTSALTNLFSPGKAGGGNVTGLKPFMVGEEGPELFMPSGSGRIVSTPALAGMGGGTVNYSPQTSITVNGNALDEKTKEELLAYIELGRARDQRQLSRIVTQNGLRGAR